MLSANWPIWPLWPAKLVGSLLLASAERLAAESGDKSRVDLHLCIMGGTLPEMSWARTWASLCSLKLGLSTPWRAPIDLSTPTTSFCCLLIWDSILPLLVIILLINWGCHLFSLLWILLSGKPSSFIVLRKSLGACAGACCWLPALVVVVVVEELKVVVVVESCSSVTDGLKGIKLEVESERIIVTWGTMKAAFLLLLLLACVVCGLNFLCDVSLLWFSSQDDSTCLLLPLKMFALSCMLLEALISSCFVACCNFGLVILVLWWFSRSWLVTRELVWVSFWELTNWRPAISTATSKSARSTSFSCFTSVRERVRQNPRVSTGPLEEAESVWSLSKSHFEEDEGEEEEEEAELRLLNSLLLLPLTRDPKSLELFCREAWRWSLFLACSVLLFVADVDVLWHRTWLNSWTECNRWCWCWLTWSMALANGVDSSRTGMTLRRISSLWLRPRYTEGPPKGSPSRAQSARSRLSCRWLKLAAAPANIVCWLLEQASGVLLAAANEATELTLAEPADCSPLERLRCCSARRSLKNQRLLMEFSCGLKQSLSSLIDLCMLTKWFLLQPHLATCIRFRLVTWFNWICRKRMFLLANFHANWSYVNINNLSHVSLAYEITYSNWRNLVARASEYYPLRRDTFISQNSQLNEHSHHSHSLK